MEGCITQAHHWVEFGTGRCLWRDVKRQGRGVVQVSARVRGQKVGFGGVVLRRERCRGCFHHLQIGGGPSQVLATGVWGEGRGETGLGDAEHPGPSNT